MTNKLLGSVPVGNSAQERRWKAEDALSTLTRAEEYRKDRGLMREVRKLAQEKLKALDRVTKGKRR